MGTPQSELLAPALDALHRAAPDAVPISDLYDAVERTVELDSDDLSPPTLRGGPTSEPSWHRNLRNALQAQKRTGGLANVSVGTWAVPRPNPARHVDPEAAWDAVARAARRAEGEAFESPVRGQRYRVGPVVGESVEIDRFDGNQGTVLTAGEVRRTVVALNAAGGRSGRRTLHYTVAKECALVYLHPDLGWDPTGEWIEATVDAADRAAREVARERARPPRCFALAADPSVYRVEEAVRALGHDWWTTRGRDLREGDRLVIWKTSGGGGLRGVVALGRVTGPAEVRADASNPFWVGGGGGVEERVPVAYEVPNGFPLWSNDPDRGGAVRALSVYRARGGTVFNVTEAEYEALTGAGVPGRAGMAEVRPRAVRPGEHVYRRSSRQDGPRQDSGDSQGPPVRGRTGPRRSARSKEVGDRAEAVVVALLRRTLHPEQAATVRWVAAAGETPGWDVEYVGADGELVAVEVKGTTGRSFKAVEVTANEWDAAGRLRERYRLALVARCEGEEPIVEFVDDPAELADGGVLSVTPSVWRLGF